MAIFPPVLSLPEELCCRIAHLLNDNDPRSLRLSCKQLYSAATESLFSSVRLCPNEDSADRFNKILACNRLNALVRHVELNTLDILKTAKQRCICGECTSQTTPA